MFFFMRLNTRTRVRCTRGRGCVQQKRDGANVIGMVWKKRKAETNELNFALQPQQSWRDQTESLFSRLLSQARW